MLSRGHQYILLCISDLPDGWGINCDGKVINPAVIRNTRFLLSLLDDDTISVRPDTDGESIRLEMTTPPVRNVIDLPEDTVRSAITVYCDRFVVDILDDRNWVKSSKVYDMDKFIDQHILN